MTLPAPTYDLMLLLDPRTEEATRAKIVADARAAIAAKGELVRDDAWGDKALAYPIERKADADYHLLQFTTGASELLGELDRTLRITDGIMRFRIIKLAPGTPAAPSDMRAAGPAGTRHAGPASSEAQAETSPAKAAPAEAEAVETPASPAADSAGESAESG